MKCFVCEQSNDTVSVMTDGRTSHNVCDGCRLFVTTLFHIYQSMAAAVHAAALAKLKASR